MASCAKPNVSTLPPGAGPRLPAPRDLEIKSVGRGLPRVEVPEGWVKKIDRAREGKVWVGYFHTWERVEWQTGAPEEGVDARTCDKT